MKVTDTNPIQPAATDGPVLRISYRKWIRGLTKTQVKEAARTLQINGRSKMTDTELREAIYRQVRGLTNVPIGNERRLNNYLRQNNGRPLTPRQLKRLRKHEPSAEARRSR